MPNGPRGPTVPLARRIPVSTRSWTLSRGVSPARQPPVPQAPDSSKRRIRAATYPYGWAGFHDGNAARGVRRSHRSTDRGMSPSPPSRAFALGRWPCLSCRPLLRLRRRRKPPAPWRFSVPNPTAGSIRPPEMKSTVAISLASNTGLRSGSARTLLPNQPLRPSRERREDAHRLEARDQERRSGPRPISNYSDDSHMSTRFHRYASVRLGEWPSEQPDAGSHLRNHLLAMRPPRARFNGTGDPGRTRKRMMMMIRRADTWVSQAYRPIAGRPRILQV